MIEREHPRDLIYQVLREETEREGREARKPGLIARTPGGDVVLRKDGVGVSALSLNRAKCDTCGRNWGERRVLLRVLATGAPRCPCGGRFKRRSVFVPVAIHLRSVAKRLRALKRGDRHRAWVRATRQGYFVPKRRR